MSWFGLGPNMAGILLALLQAGKFALFTVGWVYLIFMIHLHWRTIIYQPKKMSQFVV